MTEPEFKDDEPAENQPDMLGVDGSQDIIGYQDDLSAVPPTKWAPMLFDMVSVLEKDAINHGQTSEKALLDAQRQVAALAMYFGGQSVYIPRGNSLRKALRDFRIFREFNGKNIQELVYRYELSEQHLYVIIKEQTALHRKTSQQMRLF